LQILKKLTTGHLNQCYGLLASGVGLGTGSMLPSKKEDHG
jgi:hypothetical protein